MCACATANPNPNQIALIREGNWSNSAIAWPDFLRLAEHHGVLPLAARNLTLHARGLPPETAQSLHAAYEENLRRNLWFAAELTRIVRHFEEQQLRTLPYKGPVLANSAYGDLGLRSFNDLDLLISPVDFPRAKHALGQLGYRPSKELAIGVERLWLRTGYERSFDGVAGKNLVELQWNLLPYFYAVDPGSADFKFDDLLARSTCIDLGVGKVPCLSPEDSLLVLCLHASKHLWSRLIWVADIAEGLRMPGIDVAKVISRARALGSARILGVSLWLAEHLLDAPIPPTARQLVDDRESQSLAEDYAARLASSATYDFESVEYFRQILKLRERSSDRGRYLWRLVWTPGPGEIAAIRLPEIMFPLYRGVRIGRLLRKLIQH